MDAVAAAFGQVEAIEEGAAVLARPDLRAARPERIDRPAMVSFGPEVSGLLDLATTRDAVWLDVIRQLKDQGRPIYVEIDSETRRITQFLQPRQQPVGELKEIEGGDVRVDLLLSHAVHILRRSHPRFTELLQQLQAAQRDGIMVWVAETLDSHEIIEVR
jgi:hypothetical protein